MSINFRIVEEHSMTPALNRALIELLCQANPQEREYFSNNGRGWHGVKPAYCSIIELGGKLIGYVGVVERLVRVGPDALAPSTDSNLHRDFVTLRIAGPQNVSIHPDHRGQGLSIPALVLAMNHATHQRYDAGMLFCTPNLKRLYSKNKWQVLAATVIRTENGADLPLPPHNITMVRPLTIPAFPPGPVHLRGNDW